MESTTTQQVSGLITDTKSVSLLVAVIVFPTAPFDQTNVGLVMEGALAVMIEDVQKEF
jgi:hypothetical protein